MNGRFEYIRVHSEAQSPVPERCCSVQYQCSDSRRRTHAAEPAETSVIIAAGKKLFQKLRAQAGSCNCGIFSSDDIFSSGDIFSSDGIFSRGGKLWTRGCGTQGSGEYAGAQGIGD